MRLYSDSRKSMAWHTERCGDLIALADMLGYETDSIGIHGCLPVVWVVRPPDMDTGELVLGKIYQGAPDHFWFEGWKPELPNGLVTRSWEDLSSFHIII